MDRQAFCRINLAILLICRRWPRFEEDTMHIVRRRGWQLPEHLATPEHLFINRRMLVGAAAGTIATDGARSPSGSGRDRNP